MRTWLICTALVAYALVVSLPAGAEPDCEFVLGFSELRDVLGTEIVGDCVGNQQLLTNGDASQRTTNRVLIWRRADNATLFTDGAATWIVGPFGLQMRPSDQRFDWEMSAVEIVPAPAAPAESTSTGPSAAPGPSIPTALSGHCYQIAADIALETVPTAGSTAVGAQRAMNEICRQAAEQYGPRGVECSEWAFRRTLALARQSPSGSGDALVQLMKELIRGCAEG